MNKRERKDADQARLALIAVKELAERGIEAHRALIVNLEEVRDKAVAAIDGMRRVA